MADKKKLREQRQVGSKEPSVVVGSELALPIEMHFPEGMHGLYSNHVMVQFGTVDCTISFFEVKPPILLGTPEEQAEQVKKLSSVRADCVARIVLAVPFVPQVVGILQETLSKHLAKIAAQAESGKTEKTNSHDMVPKA